MKIDTDFLASVTWGIAIWLLIHFVFGDGPQESVFVVLMGWALAFIGFALWDDYKHPEDRYKEWRETQP